MVLLSPSAAWARVARRYATRQQEQKATFITMGCLALLFVVAYFNSKKEDSSEDKRIKSEVQRLVRLKKEFEEAENNEETSDDSLSASLRAAQQKMAQESAAEGAAEGVDGTDTKAEDDAGEKEDDAGEDEKEPDGSPGSPDKK